MGAGVRNTILQLAGTSKYTLPASLAIDEPPAHIPSIDPDEIQRLPCFIPVIIVIRKSAMKELAADGKIVVGVLAGSSESKHVFGLFGRALERLEAAASGNLLDFGDVNVSLASMEVYRNGKPVALTALEFKTLKYFLLNPGRVVSRDELLNEVWGYRNYPCTRTVDNHIMKLRQKLEPQPSRPLHFQTVHGAGYKFVPSAARDAA